MSFNELAGIIHQIAIEHGFWEASQNFGEKCALIHSEVSEAFEEYRAGHALDETYHREDGKPEGVPSELADVLIRVLDLAHWAGIDIDAIVAEKMIFNKSRPYLHGRIV